MLFRPLSVPIPPALQAVGQESLMALTGLNGDDQLEITCRHVVGILQASRSAFVGSRDRQRGFDALCDGVVEWLEAEITARQFMRAN